MDNKIFEKINLDRAVQEMELAAAVEAAIRVGKEISLMLEDHKPVTRCLVARVLAREYEKRFPQVFAQFEKLGI